MRTVKQCSPVKLIEDGLIVPTRWPFNWKLSWKGQPILVNENTYEMLSITLFLLGVR